MVGLENSTSQNILSTENQISSLPCESLSGESNDKNVSATLIDLEAFRCPFCCDVLSESIFQCENGHIACSTCCTKLKNKCTLCPLPIGKIRNRVMERVIKSVILPCPNAMFGCTKTFSYGQEVAHDKECVFSPCSCPDPKCNYTGYYKDIYKHYDDHWDIFEDNYIFIYGDFINIFLYFGDAKYTSLVLEEGVYRLMFVAQCFKEEHGVYVTMSCIAPSSLIVGEFSCRILAVAENCSITFEYLKVIKIVRKLSFKIPKEDYVLIPSYYVFGRHQRIGLSVRIDKSKKE